MSEVLPLKITSTRAKLARELRAPIIQLNFGEGEVPVIVQLANGTSGRGTCLGCRNIPCMKLRKDDIALPEAINDFPGNPNEEICPTNALLWNDTRDSVFVNVDSCIGCGLCAVRCPYGAISLANKGKAAVEDSDPDNLTQALTKRSIPFLNPKPQQKGQIGKADSVPLKKIPKAIRELTDLKSSLFVRNLLIQCGIQCRIRRRGDTNIRMDGILGLADGRIGVLEIELGDSVLESPRALLEDIAVLHGRYDIKVSQIDPLCVILKFPNVRSEYYQVIADIEKVLDIRCRTLTIGSLLMMLWRFHKVNGFPDNLFMTSTVDTDLSPALRKYISKLFPAEPYDGAYRPSK